MPNKRTLKKWRRERRVKEEASKWLDSELKKYEEEIRKKDDKNEQ